jgi:hypothetical protein
MKIKFLEVFKENNDGSLTPQRPIFINGISFGPGVTFQKGVAFGGVDFHLYKYWDIEAEDNNGVLDIKGFYQQ